MNPCDLVRTARRSAKLTQRMLSARSGVCETTVSLVENGRVWPNTANLYALVNACGFDLGLVEARTTPIGAIEAFNEATKRREER